MSMLRRTDGKQECEWVTIIMVPKGTGYDVGPNEIEFHGSEDDARKHAGLAISDGCYAYVARLEWQGGR